MSGVEIEHLFLLLFSTLLTRVRDVRGLAATSTFITLISSYLISHTNSQSEACEVWKSSVVLESISADNQNRKPVSSVQVLQRIVKEKGPGALWSG